MVLLFLIEDLKLCIRLKYIYIYIYIYIYFNIINTV